MADQQNEIGLFNKWRETGDKQYFQQLYQSMKPLITDAAKKASYGSNLPQSAHELYATQNFYEALNRYDPSKGVPLASFVYPAIQQKGLRLNYTYQNLGKISESRATKIGNYKRELANMKLELGREPSAAELADRLGYDLSDITNLQKELQKDFSLGGLEEQVTFESSKEEEALGHLYYELTNEEKTVYDYIFGKHGKPRLLKASNKINYTQIAAQVGFSESKVRTVVDRMRKKLEKYAR